MDPLDPQGPLKKIDDSFEGAAAKQDKVETPEASFEKVVYAVHKSIEISIKDRTDKLKTFPPEINGQIVSLEKTLDELKEPCLEICSLKLKLDALQDKLLNLSTSSHGENEAINEEIKILEAEIDGLDEPIQQLETAMMGIMTKFLAENRDLKMSKEWFSDWWKVDQIEEKNQALSLKFMKEQTINRCVDHLSFLNDTRLVIEANKKLIVEQFCSQDASTLDFEHIVFDLLPQGSETHNRGKVPTKISFRLGETELFKVFFKPRDAQIDAKIIQLFNNLNKLSPEEKSLKIDLPSYKIINLTHQGLSFSLWEFIEGDHKIGQTASSVIQSLADSPEKTRLSTQLLRLESVCRFLHISDLHLENILFSHLGSDESKIFIIDLESLQPGHPTGLFVKDPEIPPLTDQENKLLTNCQQEIGEVPVRFVPIPTSNFLGGLTRCDSFITMASFVQKSIQEKGYSFLISKEELEWMILTDFLHNDVPYLTQYQSSLYYMSAGKPQEIASKGGSAKKSKLGEL